MSGVSENHWRGKAYKTDLAFVNEIDFFVPCDPAKSHGLFKSVAASAFMPSGWCIGNGAINDPVDAGYAGDKPALDRGFAAASTSLPKRKRGCQLRLRLLVDVHRKN